MTDVNTPEGEGRDRDEEGQRVVPAEEVSQIVEQRVNQANAKHDEANVKRDKEMSHLQGQLDALTKTQKPVDTTWSQTDLEQAVTDNKITQTEAQNIWQKQERTETEKFIKTTINEAFNSATRNTSIQSQIDKYFNANPDLRVVGSDAEQKVQNEIRIQLNNSGLSVSNVGIELNALRTLFGPPESLGNTDALPRQTHQETGGVEGVNDQPTSGLFKNATATQKAYYQQQMDKGNYTIEQVEKELNSKFNKHGKV